MNFSRPPCHPPPNIYIWWITITASLNGTETVRESDRERERKKEEGGGVSHYRDTVIRREHWVKELWFDRDLGWIGEGQRFSRGHRIQSWLDFPLCFLQNPGVFRDFSQGHADQFILFSPPCPITHLTANREVSHIQNLSKWHHICTTT